MTKVIRIDKREDNQGYSIHAEGQTIVMAQGVDGLHKRIIVIKASQLESLIADLDSVMNELAYQGVA